MYGDATAYGLAVLLRRAADFVSGAGLVGCDCGRAGGDLERLSAASGDVCRRTGTGLAPGQGVTVDKLPIIAFKKILIFCRIFEIKRLFCAVFAPKTIRFYPFFELLGHFAHFRTLPISRRIPDRESPPPRSHKRIPGHRCTIGRSQGPAPLGRWGAPACPLAGSDPATALRGMESHWLVNGGRSEGNRWLERNGRPARKKWRVLSAAAASALPTLPPPRNCHLICRPYPLDSLAPTVLGWVETWQFPKHDNFQGVTHLCGFSLHPLTQEAGD